LPNAAAPAALQTDVLSSLRLIARQLPSLPSIVQVSPGQGTPPRRGEPGYRDAGAGRFILRSFIIPHRWYMAISFVSVCFRGDEGEGAPVDDRATWHASARDIFTNFILFPFRRYVIDRSDCPTPLSVPLQSRGGGYAGQNIDCEPE
jgi:hypothetical protein